MTVELTKQVFRRKETTMSAAQELRSELRERIRDQLGAYDEWDVTHDLPRSTFYILQECLRWLSSRPWPEPPE